jgi:hypothetical protein
MRDARGCCAVATLVGAVLALPGAAAAQSVPSFAALAGPAGCLSADRHTP